MRNTNIVRNSAKKKINLQYSTEQITNKVDTKINSTEASYFSGNNLEKKKESSVREFLEYSI